MATFFGRPAETTIHFLVTKPSLINVVDVFGLLVTVLTGLHCTGKQTVYVSCESIVTEVAFERSEEVGRGSKVRTTFNMSPY